MRTLPADEIARTTKRKDTKRKDSRIRVIIRGLGVADCVCFVVELGEGMRI